MTSKIKFTTTYYYDSENEEHRVVNGEDIPTYRNNVMKSYEDASKMFMQTKQASQTVAEIQQNTEG